MTRIRGPYNRIKGIIQENIGVCPTCFPPFNGRMLLMFWVFNLLAVIYSIFKILIPFPRMLVHGLEFIKSLVTLPFFPCYIGYHGYKLYETRRSTFINNRVGVESHLALQHSLVLLAVAHAILIVPVALEVEHYYPQVSSFIQQTETAKFDVSADGVSPDPPYFIINSLCNGVYPCGAGQYIAKTFVAVLIISVVFLLGGYHLRAAIFCKCGS